MIAIFDEDGGGNVDFQEFVSGLSAFSSKGNKEQKLRFAFKVYDIDRDGYISNGELFIVLKMMVGSNLKDQQLQQIVDKTIMEADLDKDGKISFEEFSKMVENTDVSMSMTLGECSCYCSSILRKWLTVWDAQTNSNNVICHGIIIAKMDIRSEAMGSNLCSPNSKNYFRRDSLKVAGKSPNCGWEVLHLSIVGTRLQDELLCAFRVLGGGLVEVAPMRLRVYPSAYSILPANLVLPITRLESNRARSPVLPTCVRPRANWIAASILQ